MNLFKKYLTLISIGILFVLALSTAGVLQSGSKHHTVTRGAADCASFCSTLPTRNKLEQDFDEEDDQPHPATLQPFYAQFITISWATGLLGVVLARHLKWRPPDLVLQYANLRI